MKDRFINWPEPRLRCNQWPGSERAREVSGGPFQSGAVRRAFVGFVKRFLAQVSQTISRL